MLYRIFLLCFIWGAVSYSLKGQFAQDTIPCGLLYISELTIEKNPQIQRQRLRIKQAKADRQLSSSIFDYRLVSSLSYNRDKLHLFNQDSRFEVTNGQIHTNSYISNIGLQRTFRSGLSSNINLDYSRTANNYPFSDFGEEIGPFISDNFSSVSMSIIQPLLKGRGRKFATANERASSKMIESNVLDMTYVSANELKNMALSYWEYLSSYKRLGIYRENENRVRKVLEITQELVEADRKAQNDLIQIQADLAGKERQSLVATQSLFSARQNLGRSIGLNEIESIKIGIPLSDYPLVEEANYSSDINLESFLKLARENRADLKALLIVKEALDINFIQAQNNLKPQLDVQTSLAYGGTDLGNGFSRIITPLSRVPGRNIQFGFGLSFQFPLNNNAAEAGLVKAQAAVADQQVIIDNQIRNIELNISIALNELHNSVLKLEKATQALSFYQEVFNDEQIKFQNGLTTLLNLILFQERLTFAQLDYLDAQQEFANTIINLRNETGTLITVDDAKSLSMDNMVFYKLPD